MADPFVIYTMGESGLFASALNGVAMLFNDTALYHGNGVGNLGFGAFFGMMLLFTVWLYNAAFKQQMDMRALLAPLIVYMVLTVPKATVAIEDIYTGNVKAVANVPLGLALPASVASGISVVFTEIIEKAYQVVDNYPNGYMPKISEEGYVTPLKLINALRDSASIVPSQSLLQTTKSIYQSCIVGNPNFNVEDYKKHADPMLYFTNAAKANSGNVVYVTLAVTGTTTEHIMTCTTAAEELQKAMDAYIDGTNNSASGSTKINKIIGDVTLYNLKNSMIRQMSANGETAGFNPKPSAGNSNYDVNNLVNYVSLMGNTSQDNARHFMMATIFNPMLETASYCYDKADGMAGMSKCSAWISSRSQWEEKNAAAGTGFLQVMRDGQNVLIMLSFLFFPIIVLFIMIQGTASFKLLGNYMAFTVAAYLWLPMAAIINFYIQNTLADEWFKVASATGVSTLNLVTGPQFYAAVSQKLSLANALLASVPVLCMMLFSGMMMGMNQIYARMNSADAGNYDAKVNTPDVSKSAPMATTNSAVSISGQSVATANGMAQASISSSQSMKSGTDLSQTLSTQHSNVQSTMATLNSSLGASIGNAKTSATATGNSEQSAVANQVTNGSVVKSGSGDSTAVVDAQQTALGNNVATSDTTATNAGATAGAKVGLNGGLGKDNPAATKNNANPDDSKKKLAGKLEGVAGANIGGSVGGSRSNTAQQGVQLENAHTGSLNTTENKYNSTDSTSSNSKNRSHTAAQFQQDLDEWKRVATLQKGSDFVKQHSSDVSKAQQEINALKRTEQETVAFANNTKIDANAVTPMVKANPQGFDELKNAANNANDPKFEAAYQNARHSNNQLVNQEDKDAYAMVSAGLASDNPQIAAAAMRFSSNQSAERYGELSNGVGNVSVSSVRDSVEQQVAGVQPQIQAAQDRTGITPNPNALPNQQTIKAPNSDHIQAPKRVNASTITVDPVSYSDQAKDANQQVEKGTKYLLSAQPK